MFGQTLLVYLDVWCTRWLFFLENCLFTLLTLFWIKNQSGAHQLGCLQMVLVCKKLNLCAGTYTRTPQGPRQGLWRTSLIPPASLLSHQTPAGSSPVGQWFLPAAVTQVSKRSGWGGAVTALRPQPGEHKIIVGKGNQPPTSSNLCSSKPSSSGSSLPHHDHTFRAMTRSLKTLGNSQVSKPIITENLAIETISNYLF